MICVLGLTMRWQWLPWPAIFGTDGWLASKQNYGAAYLVNFLAFSYLVYCLAATSRGQSVRTGLVSFEVAAASRPLPPVHEPSRAAR